MSPQKVIDFTLLGYFLLLGQKGWLLSSEVSVGEEMAIGPLVKEVTSIVRGLIVCKNIEHSSKYIESNGN